MKMHHLGLAVENIESALLDLSTVTDIDFVSDTVYDSEQKANLCMVTVKNGTSIELIQGEMVSKLVKKGQHFYHICWETDDMEQEIQNITEKGGMVISAPKPAILFNNRKVAFVMTDLGLFEIVESEK